VVGVANAPSAGLRVSGGSGGLRGQLEAEKMLEENRREQMLRGGGEEAQAMTHCVADGLRPVCGRGRSVCVFREKVQPLL